MLSGLIELYPEYTEDDIRQTICDVIKSSDNYGQLVSQVTFSF